VSTRARTAFLRWFPALIAVSGAVSLRRNFGGSPGAVGLALGLIAPILCLAATLAVIVFAVRSRRQAP
jgi:hypothetical protein